jgi:hypothetical protein
LLSSAVASAEPDSFGIGDGHSGPHTVTAGDQEVNSYAGVTADVAAGSTSITITQTVLGPAFAANDLVMVWRATGVDASEAKSGDQTTRVDLSKALATTSTTTLSAGLVGRYEYARVSAVTGSVLTLTKPLVSGFTKNVTQVVRVPEYTTVTLSAGTSMRARPWQELSGDPAHPNPANPWVGGILVVFANSEIKNDGILHANARGFHGGTPVAANLNLNLTCSSSNLDGDPTTANSQYSPKGEGIVQSKFTAQSGGKGNIANAGGGGDCFESGGGGGANFGNGGNGGTGAATQLLTPNSNGLGAVGIDYDILNRLTMGGGGGAGRHTTALDSSVSFGGFGGGVVYLRASTISGAGKVQANGGDGEDSGLVGLPAGVASEGSGGGGAGGTVVIRLTGTLACGQVASIGGNGGDAEVVGLNVFGAGGGGGGGRVFFQAQSGGGACPIAVNAGNAGNQTQGGAQNGTVGGTTGGSGPPLCVPAGAGVPGNCPATTPVCDPNTGLCTTCSGPFGSGPPDPCPTNLQPVCLVTGSCVPCNGDFGSGATQSCQLANAPTCLVTSDPTVSGSCGKCKDDTDCTNTSTADTHTGPRCDTASGACGTPCTKDADCKTTEWCAPTSSTGGVCVPKVPNGQPLPNQTPINGDCTPENGQRTCLSAVCEDADNLCGKKNSSPCAGNAQCRSLICFDDHLCGKPNGQPCSGDGQCRSDLCESGTCTGKPCGSDVDCPSPGQICDVNSKKCIDGCHPGLTEPGDGGAPINGTCELPTTCVGDGGTVGTCTPGDGGLTDGGTGSNGLNPGSTAGLIEGGGCSCNTALSSAASPLSLLGVLCSGLILMRRRTKRRTRG